MRAAATCSKYTIIDQVAGLKHHISLNKQQIFRLTSLFAVSCVIVETFSYDVKFESDLLSMLVYSTVEEVIGVACSFTNCCLTQLS